MGIKKDYYELLGLTNDDKKLPFDEFKKKLKQNYKKMALKYHPDKQQGKSDEEKKIAEDKFKEIGEAYEVLSDEKKKNEYDNPMGFASGFDFGGSSFNGGFGDDIENLMRGFGFDFGDTRKTKPRKGQSIRIVIPLSLEDIFNGITKQIKYNRNVICDDCHGTGMGKDSRKETCTHCGGTGKVFTRNGNWQTIETCPHCNGTGSIIKNPCKKCHGSGLVNISEIVEIEIPKGVFEGSQLVLNGKGNSIPNGADGDLLVVIKEKQHDKFIRRDNDLYFQLDVPIIDAILGCEMVVDTIDGKKLTTKIQSGISNGSKIRFAKKGMPIYGSKHEFGDMYGVVNLVLPKKLSDDEIKVLKSLQGKGNFK